MPLDPIGSNRIKPAILILDRSSVHGMHIPGSSNINIHGHVNEMKTSVECPGESHIWAHLIELGIGVIDDNVRTALQRPKSCPKALTMCGTEIPDVESVLAVGDVPEVSRAHDDVVCALPTEHLVGLAPTHLAVVLMVPQGLARRLHKRRLSGPRDPTHDDHLNHLTFS